MVGEGRLAALLPRRPETCMSREAVVAGLWEGVKDAPAPSVQINATLWLCYVQIHIRAPHMLREYKKVPMTTHCVPVHTCIHIFYKYITAMLKHCKDCYVHKYIYKIRKV